MSTKTITKTEQFELELNIDAARAKVGNIDSEIAANETKLPALQKAMLETAEHAGEPYDTAEAGYLDAVKEIRRLRVAHAAATQKLKALELEQSRGFSLEHQKRLTRIRNKRAETVIKLQDANATEAHLWRELLAANQALAAAWVGPIPLGGMLGVDETVRAYEVERYRVSAADAMDKQRNIASTKRGLLPGGKYHELPGDVGNMQGLPSRLMSFKARIDMENQYLAEVASGTRHPRTGEAIAPDEPLADDAPVSAEMFEQMLYGDPKAPKMSVDQIMATMPRKVRLA